MTWRLTNFLIIHFISALSVLWGQTIKISGNLINKDENRAVSSGAVTLNPENISTISDQEGNFFFITKPGLKEITTSVMGYKTAYITLNAQKDTTISIYLHVLSYELREVIITSDSVKNVVITPYGSFVLTPAALRETPRLFSEPDLLKSFQILPGVIAGKDGTSDIYVRGGGPGQNVILANGCYFFLPGHLLGIVSPYDLDFLESAELYKDYFPAELGGGASSVISLDFKKPQSDSLRTQLRLGLLSSGATIELPFKKIGLNITAGVKRGNYSLYSPLLKKIVSSDVGSFLPPDNYSFYDGFIKVSHSSDKWGNLSYLFFGNYDNGKNEDKISSQSTDTIIKYTDGMSTGWNNIVNAVLWELPVRNSLKWKFNLNFNRLSMNRNIYSQTEKTFNGELITNEKTAYSFSPVTSNFGSTLTVTRDNEKLSWLAGVSGRIQHFNPNIVATGVSNNSELVNKFGVSTTIIEPTGFFSSTTRLSGKLFLDAGLRLSLGFTNNTSFIIPEPRLRLSFNPEGSLSPHINYVRLSQFDHSIEGSNAGLRTSLWLPVSKDFGPEISNILSAGFQGQITNGVVWSLDGYMKKTSGMIDFKPGASFIFDTTFVDMLDKIKGRAYGLEVGIVKNRGKITGSLSYTYSRSKREWDSPEGIIWIPSSSDRPHNLFIALKYYYKQKTSFGINWVYQSGAPATIYMHETSYGEFFETKNNIRYFDYHRLDISIRRIIYKRHITILLDADIYNVYNHKNTFYFKKVYDQGTSSYYFQNISLFPVMPSLTLTIKY